MPLTIVSHSENTEGGVVIWDAEQNIRVEVHVNDTHVHVWIKAESGDLDVFPRKENPYSFRVSGERVDRARPRVLRPGRLQQMVWDINRELRSSTM